MSFQNTIFRVVTYHRIAPVNRSLELDPAMISATPKGFRQQMYWLARHYNVISIMDILDALTNGTNLPSKAVLISFDDGYHDLLQYAWPTLKQYNLPAVIFVATDFVNHPNKAFWWDRIAAAIYNTSKTSLTISPFDLPLPGNPTARKKIVKVVQSHLKTLDHNDMDMLIETICHNLDEPKISKQVSLDWQQLRQLQNSGIAIGAHSQHHPLLTRIKQQQAREEILGSQENLQHELGNSLPIFCYPNGNHNRAIMSILRDNGFQLAFTTLDGHNDLRSDNLLSLRRTNITRRTSMPIFKFRLTRLGSIIDSCRHKNIQS